MNDFYPAVTKELLSKSFSFAETKILNFFTVYQFLETKVVLI